VDFLCGKTAIAGGPMSASFPSLSLSLPSRLAGAAAGTPVVITWPTDAYTTVALFPSYLPPLARVLLLFKRAPLPNSADFPAWEYAPS